jgi:hypothetical protein
MAAMIIRQGLGIREGLEQAIATAMKQEQIRGSFAALRMTTKNKQLQKQLQGQLQKQLQEQL